MNDTDMRQESCCPYCGRPEQEKQSIGEGLLYVDTGIWEGVGRPETPEAWRVALLLPETYTVQSVGKLPDGRFVLHMLHRAIPAGIGVYVLPEIVPFYEREYVGGVGTAYLKRVEIRQWNKESGWQTVAVTDERQYEEREQENVIAEPDEEANFQQVVEQQVEQFGEAFPNFGEWYLSHWDEHGRRSEGG